MNRPCQGYCGGVYPISELGQVGGDGERFCSQCRQEWRSNRRRRING